MRRHFYICLLLMLAIGCEQRPHPPNTAPAVVLEEGPIGTFRAIPIPDTISLVSLESVTPQGFRVVENPDLGPIACEGELNGDSLPDIAVLLEQLQSEEGNSAIMVALGKTTGGYEFTQESGLLGPEPLVELVPGYLKIVDSVLWFHYQSLMWSGDYGFQWDKAKRSFHLIAAYTESFAPPQLGIGGRVDSTDYITGKQVTYLYARGKDRHSMPLSIKHVEVSTEPVPLYEFDQDFIYGYE